MLLRYGKGGHCRRHRWVLGDHMHRHVACRILAADERHRLMIAEHDQHGLVGGLRQHEGFKRFQNVGNRTAVLRAHFFRLFPKLFRRRPFAGSVEDLPIAHLVPRHRLGQRRPRRVAAHQGDLRHHRLAVGLGQFHALEFRQGELIRHGDVGERFAPEVERRRIVHDVGLEERRFRPAHGDFRHHHRRAPTRTAEIRQQRGAVAVDQHVIAPLIVHPQAGHRSAMGQPAFAAERR